MLRKRFEKKITIKRRNQKKQKQQPYNSFLPSTPPTKKLPARSRTADDDFDVGINDDDMSIANMSMIADDDEPPQQHYPLSSSPLSTSTLSGSGGTVIDLSASRTSTPLRVVLPMQPAKHGFYVAAAPMPPLMSAVVTAAAGRASVGESSDYIECSPAGTEVLLLLLLQTHHHTAQHNSKIQYNCEACTLSLFLCLCQYKLTQQRRHARNHTRHSQPPAKTQSFILMSTTRFVYIFCLANKMSGIQ